MKTTETLIRLGKATVVDVRTYTEFIATHVKGSMNIPLQDLPTKLEELKKTNNIVLCCASGNRIEQAMAYLKQNGIECENAGPWMNVNYFTNL